jgi:hypothetical protein
MGKLRKDNFNVVLDNIKKSFNDNPDEQNVWIDVVDDMLDSLHGDDFFGTEGQGDPRGDRRND